MINKPKITGIISKEDNDSQVNFFTITITDELHKSLMSFFERIGFKNNEISELDTPFQNQDIFIFLHNKDSKVYLVNGQSNSEILLIMNTNIRKEDLINRLQESFEIL